MGTGAEAKQVLNNGTYVYSLSSILILLSVVLLR